MGCAKGLGNHGVFMRCDVGTSRGAEVEDTGNIGLLRTAGEISRHEATHIFGEGNAHFGRTPTGLPMQLGLEANLGSNHDHAIITRFGPA